MPQGVESLDGIVNVVPLQSILKKNINSDATKNYQEFKAVYSRNDAKFEMNHAEGPKRGSDVRPRTNLTTITMDMTGLGSERAILQPRRRLVLKSSKLRANEFEVEKKVTIQTEPSIVQKLTEMEKRLERKPSLELEKTPSSFLERTNLEITIAAEQLEHIKTLIKMKEAVKPKKPKTLKSKSIRYGHRHKDCLRKNYMSTLTTVQQKLQTLEDKYFSRPKIMYRNVNDSFTQYTDVETLYESNKMLEEKEVDDTLKDLIQELDELTSRDEEAPRDYPPRDLSLASPLECERSEGMTHLDTEKIFLVKNGETGDSGSKYPSFDNESNEEHIKENSCYSYNRLSFKKPQSFVPKDAISKFIDESESRLRRFRMTKQDIIDIEAVCDKIRDLTNEDETENMNSKDFVDSTSFFDGTELQQKVSKSCYLTKEFGAVKVFSEERPRSRLQSSFKSVTSLIKSVACTLQHSICEVGAND